MRPIIRCISLTLLLVAASGAGAQDNGKRVRYKWKDAEGALHIEDSIPPEAAKLGYEVLGPNGTVVRRVERARTEEEIAAAREAAAREVEEKKKATEQASRDAQMIAAYPTEDDLLKAQQSQLTMINQSIDTASSGVKNQEKSLEELLGHAAELERLGKPVPANIQQQIAGLRKGIAEQKAFIERRTAERARMQAEFEAQTAHYREVKARTDGERNQRPGDTH